MRDMLEQRFFFCFGYTYSQSFKIAMKLYLPFCPLACDVTKQIIKLLVILPLAIFYYLSITIADQNMSFHGQIRRVAGQVTI